MNQRKMEIKVGLFLLAVLLSIAAVIVYVGIQKDLFAERIEYVVVSKTGEKIESGMPVRLSGFTIGQVSQVTLDQVDLVRITITILKRYQQWFKEDSRIILEQEGVIGNSFLKLIPGSEASPVLEEGAVIRLDKIGGISELIQEMQPVIEALRAIVINLWDLTDYLVDSQGPVRKILVNAETMTERLLSEQGLVHYLTEDPRPIAHVDQILARTDKAMESADTLLQSVTHRVEDVEPLQDEITAAVRETRLLIEEFQGIRQDLTPLMDNITEISEEVKTASQDLISLRRQGEYSLRLGTELLLRLKETWPLSRRDAPETQTSYPWP
jgi:phospholipid/cholesterol/gamma-HCH transport system substrate-binding protein